MTDPRQWCDLQLDAPPPPPVAVHPSSRRHRFFDSKGPGGIVTLNPDAGEGAEKLGHGGQTLTFKRDQHKLYAHNGYIYCMLLVRGLEEWANGEEVLLTGSGDGSVKLWELGKCPEGSLVELAELKTGNDSVLSIAVDGAFLYCGLAGGAVYIWNLDSRQIIRKLTSHSGDLWAIDVVGNVTITGDSSGVIRVYMRCSLYGLRLSLTIYGRNLTPDSKRSAHGLLTKERCWRQQLVFSMTGVSMLLVATIIQSLFGI